MAVSFRAVAHPDLASADLEGLQALFDAEYRAVHGPWSPDAPYGYAPADLHALAFVGGRLAGHIGFQRRVVLVGDAEVTVAGVGGVLTAPHARGQGLGRDLMRFAQDRMRDDPEIAFGYLGCRVEVVPFYESVGWRRIRVRERSTSRTDPHRIALTDGDPILICAAAAAVDDWPAGDVDLRGRPW